MAEKKRTSYEAAEKTTAVLQRLQSRLSREAAGARSAQPEVPDELGATEEYFAAAAPAPLMTSEAACWRESSRGFYVWQEPARLSATKTRWSSG
jgi:hypothetical protein